MTLLFQHFLVKQFLKRALILIVTFIGGTMLLGVQGGGTEILGIPEVYAQLGTRPIAGLEDIEQTEEQSGGFLETIDIAIRFLSRAWIIPASLAGELMTNEVIYGKSFYLVNVLFEFWQFIRTLAMYTLGFLFLYKIFAPVFKGESASGLGGTILKTLAAGILINMSRWLIAALIDLSIIATAAVSSLPLNAMEQLRESGDITVTCSETVFVEDYQIQERSYARTAPLTFEDAIPDGDSVAGVFVFMGCGLLRLDQSMTLTALEGEETINSQQIAGVFIRILQIVMLVVPMFVLLVVNVMRMVFIWLWIVTIPFIILDALFDGPLTKNENFSIANILGLVFQPVVVVGTLSVGMLIIIGMYGAMQGNEQLRDEGVRDLIGVEFVSDKTSLIGQDTNSQVIVDGDFFGSAADLIGGGIGTLITSIFIIFLLWSLIKIGLSTAALTKGVVDGIYGFTEKALSTIPIIPVPGAGLQSISSLDRAATTIKQQSPLRKKLAYQTDQIEKAIRGEESDTLSNQEQASLETAGRKVGNSNNYWDFWKKLKTYQKTKAIAPNEARSAVNNWLTANASNIEVGLPFTRGLLVGKSIDDINELWTSEDVKAKEFRKRMNGMLFGQIGDVEEIGLNTLTDRAAESTSDRLPTRYEKIN